MTGVQTCALPIWSILKDHRAIGDEVFNRFNVTKDETLDYYVQLVDVLRLHGPAFVVEELARVVAELHQLAGRAAAV